jgi:hypothetical protein
MGVVWRLLLFVLLSFPRQPLMLQLLLLSLAMYVLRLVSVSKLQLYFSNVVCCPCRPAALRTKARATHHGFAVKFPSRQQNRCHGMALWIQQQSRSTNTQEQLLQHQPTRMTTPWAMVHRAAVQLSMSARFYHCALAESWAGDGTVVA